MATTTSCYGKNITTKYCYEKVWSFRNGLARVERQGKFGFINKKGEEVIECKYHWINYFSSISNLASFTDTLKRFGFIDKKGNIIVEPKYQAIYDWDINTGLVYVNRDGRFGFMNKNGIEIIPCIYDQTHGTPEHFYKGIVRMRKNGKYGILDINGKTVVDFEYDFFYGYEWLEGFPKEYMVAKKDGEYFYINMKTFETIKTPYEYAGEFHDGMGMVKMGNSYGYVNSSFKLSVPCVYRIARNFSEGLAAVSDSSEKWGYVDRDGNLVIPFDYDKAAEFCNGRAMIVKDSMVGFIDKTGKLIIPLMYDYTSFTNFYYKRKKGFQDNLCVLSKKGKYGIIDTSGNILLDFKYDNISFATDYQLNLSDWFPISSNYALARLNDELFIVNKSGKITIAYSSSHLIYFIENISYVCDTTDKCGFIQSTGELIIPFIYDYYEYSTFYKGYAVVKSNDKFGIIDKKGKIIIKTIYDDLSNFGDKLAKATIEGTTYFINKKGKIQLTICANTQ